MDHPWYLATKFLGLAQQDQVLFLIECQVTLYRVDRARPNQAILMHSHHTQAQFV